MNGKRQKSKGKRHVTYDKKLKTFYFDLNNLLTYIIEMKYEQIET